MTDDSKKKLKEIKDNQPTYCYKCGKTMPHRKFLSHNCKGDEQA